MRITVACAAYTSQNLTTQARSAARPESFLVTTGKSSVMIFMSSQGVAEQGLEQVVLVREVQVERARARSSPGGPRRRPGRLEAPLVELGQPGFQQLAYGLLPCLPSALPCAGAPPPSEERRLARRGWPDRSSPPEPASGQGLVAGPLAAGPLSLVTPGRPAPRHLATRVPLSCQRD